ncbi:sigma 54-interacting transcriptional regulator [Desulfovibrio sp. OttesenSCG-928-C14]|nr:sigma 54-interacting transcriptional regulator [Desulfovibrio sp. OttesenSCG-928-C14]
MECFQYTRDYLDAVTLEQELFHQGKSLGPSPAVRPDILASWKRSRAYLGLSPGKKHKRLPPEEMAEVLLANQELLSCAVPVMDYLKTIVCSSSCGIILTDKDGVILHVNGDGEVLASHPAFVRGTVVTEKEEGTNSIGLCLELRTQAEVFGPEHYNPLERDWCCISAPLWGGKRRMMGVITVVLRRPEPHIHTAGMLMMAAKDINDQHHLHDLLSDQDAILELTGIGLLVLDKMGGIKAANSKGRAMLHLPCAPAPLGGIADVLVSTDPFLSILTAKKKISDQEVFLHLRDDEYLQCVLSATPIPNDKGTVISMYDMDRARQLGAHGHGNKAVYTFESIIGDSAPVRKAVELCRVAANSDITSLILGESGTGKELFAHAIHNGSSRRDKPFVIVNCGSLPRDLIQSELFGYDAGAFTGAQKGGKAGKFELADKGTVFLDEIGDMPLEAQINLLRLIQNGEVARVGGKHARHVDVRIIAATNKNLLEAVKNGRFREDLFYRLSVLTIDVPPLRERNQDIPLLADFFLRNCSRSIHKKVGGINREAMRALCAYDWPGNVRELENVIERALNVTRGPDISVEDLPGGLQPTAAGKSARARQGHGERVNPPPGPAFPLGPEGALRSLEAEALVECLRKYSGNMRKAAQALGISRSALYLKLGRLGLDAQSFRTSKT